jgi:hypothetical protein
VAAASAAVVVDVVVEVVQIVVAAVHLVENDRAVVPSLPLPADFRHTLPDVRTSIYRQSDMTCSGPKRNHTL